MTTVSSVKNGAVSVLQAVIQPTVDGDGVGIDLAQVSATRRSVRIAENCEAVVLTRRGLCSSANTTTHEMNKMGGGRAKAANSDR
jgi:hypothetical protein